MPITTFGYIVEARRRCRGVGTGLFTVMSRENLPGGGLGKIVSPQNLAVVTTAVQAPGKDAEILKKAAPFSLGLLVLLGALVFIAAQGWLGGYFPPGEPPGPSPLRPLRSTPFAEIGPWTDLGAEYGVSARLRRCLRVPHRVRGGRRLFSAAEHPRRCSVGVVVVGAAHGRPEPLRGCNCFLLE